MSLETEIKALTLAVTALTTAMAKQAIPDVGNIGSANTPAFLQKGAEAFDTTPAGPLAPLVTITEDSPLGDGIALVTDADGAVGPGVDELSPRQIAARKAADTRKRNKAAKIIRDAMDAQADKTAPPSTLRQLSPQELGYQDGFAAEEPEADGFEASVDELSSFDAGVAQGYRVSVMQMPDPRTALRDHLNTIVRQLSAIGEGPKVAKLMQDMFETKTFTAVPEDRFDEFLDAAINLMPEDKRVLIS